MNNQLTAIVLTQEDRFFIPKILIDLSGVCKILMIVKVNHKSALENKLKDFITWFGWFQVGKLMFLLGLRVLFDLIDKTSGFKFFKGLCSIKSVANYLNVPYLEIDNINAHHFIEDVEIIKPDLIISYSLPQLIKAKLLSIPKKGAINVHGSYLPYYRGCLPSFWQLYNDEKYAGATVHFMNEKIDEGDIIIQEKVDISRCRSMYEVIKLTKNLGSKLLIEALEKIKNENVSLKVNDLSRGSYFSWPKKEDAKAFKKKGKKLI